MKKIVLIVLTLIFSLAGCNSLSGLQKYDVSIEDAGVVSSIRVSPGTTVDLALSNSGIKLNPLDKVIPSLNSSINEPITIKIIRVTEEYSVEESILPFEQQTVKNESLQEGQKVLIQSGVNGKIQTIYRVVYENGVKVSSTFVSSETTVAAQPEIMMIGVQSPYSVQAINGILAYVSSGNAWIMDANTGNRRPVTTTGDLDGRVFSISPDRAWLMYTTSNDVDTDNEINRLWIVSLSSNNPSPKDTGITNIVSYAEWVPGRVRTISYSTADASSSPPFWNANNNLLLLRVDGDGNQIEKKTLVDTNSGGLYGWWGSTFKWSHDGQKVAFARPDSIGLVDIERNQIDQLFQINPYQTESVWAWVPDISWSADDTFLLTTLPDTSSTDPLQSANLSAINIKSRNLFVLYEDCGLFCSASFSSPGTDGPQYIAFLSAILPDQSEISRYNLNVMDKDGSNQRKLYPGEGIQGLKTQSIFWEPILDQSQQPRVAFIAQGNLLIAELSTGSIKQITGDGSIEKIDWK